MSELIIIPGEGTGLFQIGSNFSEVTIDKNNIYETEVREDLIVYKTEHIWFFVNEKTDEIEQLSFLNDYRGKVLGKVGLGDTLDCVYREFGKCSVDNQVFEPLKYPGVTFELNSGSHDKFANIEVISIIEPYKFFGELPEHIKNNLGNKPKLP